MSDPWRPSFGQGSNPPPAVSKKRRTAAQSDDEVKANIVEGHCRTGWPRLMPHPTRNHLIHNPDAYVKNYDEMMSTFSAILTAQAVNFTKIRLVQRKSAGSSQSSYPTLLIEASTSAGSWFNAVLRLVRVLETTVADYDGSIYVEIFRMGYDDPRVLPIRANDNVLSLWHNLGPSAVQVLSQFPVQWKLLSLVKLECRVYGNQSGSPATTMLIEAWDANDDIWELTIVPHLKALIANTSIANLDIWQAYKYTAAGDSPLEVPRLPERTWWEKSLRMGDGLGPQGFPVIGTLGGFLTIEDQATKNKTTCLLTNFHVVRNCPGLKARITPTPPEKALKSLSITGSNHFLKSPTEPDVARKIELLEREIKGTKKDIYGEDLPPGSPPCISDRAEMGDERAIKALGVAQQMISNLEGQINKLSNTDQFLAGRVRALSGFQYLTKPDGKKMALDWALAEVHPSRPVDLKFPRDNQVQGDLDLPFWAWQEFSSCRKISSFKTGDVLKVGRATGWSSGEINYAEAWLSLRKEEGHGTLWEQEYGTVVNCMRIENPHGQQQAFSIRGDSGSMILDAVDGACVGLLFGGDEGETYGLMTPIEDVIHSVEQVTGCKVVQPQFTS